MTYPVKRWAQGMWLRWYTSICSELVANLIDKNFLTSDDDNTFAISS